MSTAPDTSWLASLVADVRGIVIPTLWLPTGFLRMYPQDSYRRKDIAMRILVRTSIGRGPT